MADTETDYVAGWNPDDPLAAMDGESTAANQALNDYALLGTARSLSGLLEQYRALNGAKTGPPTKRLNTLKDWSARFDWVARVAASDELLRKAERAALAAVREQRSRELADRNWETSQKLAERVAEMLGYPLAQVEKIQKRRQLDDGRTTIIDMSVVRPAKWSFQTAAVMADIASKLGALAVGEPTERTAHQLEGLTKRDLEEMPLEQLLALKAQVDG